MLARDKSCSPRRAHDVERCSGCSHDQSQCDYTALLKPGYSDALRRARVETVVCRGWNFQRCERCVYIARVGKWMAQVCLSMLLCHPEQSKTPCVHARWHINPPTLSGHIDVFAHNGPYSNHAYTRQPAFTIRIFTTQHGLERPGKFTTRTL